MLAFQRERVPHFSEALSVLESALAAEEAHLVRRGHDAAHVLRRWRRARGARPRGARRREAHASAASMPPTKRGERRTRPSQKREVAATHRAIRARAGLPRGEVLGRVDEREVLEARAQRAARGVGARGAGQPRRLLSRACEAVTRGHDDRVLVRAGKARRHRAGDRHASKRSSALVVEPAPKRQERPPRSKA